MYIKKCFFKVWSFYYDGFREMTLGRVVLRVFFFPDFVATHATEGDEARFVGEELMERRAP